MGSFKRLLTILGRGAVVVAVPPSVRRASRQLAPVVLAPLARLVLLLFLAAVVAGTVMAVRGGVWATVARPALLLVAAAAILAVSGALGPQGRLLARYMERRSWRRGEMDATWRGRGLRTLAHWIERALVRPARDKGDREDGHGDFQG